MEHCRLRLAWGVLVALSVLLAVAAPLQAVTVEESERFLFWTGCSPLRLNILMLPDSIAPDPDSVSMGLTEAVVTTAVRSRLRAARIYADNEEAPVLIVNLRVIHSKQRPGGAFAVDITLHKRVYDPLSGVSGYVQTAVCNITLGLHAGQAAFILSTIAQRMDEFIDNYLRVNEPACPRSPIDP